MRLLADFGERHDLASGPVWPVYGRPGLWVAGPSQVGLAQRGDMPAFGLSLRRSSDPDAGPDPYGVLDLTLEARRDIAQAQEEMSQNLPGLQLTAAPVDRVALDLADGGAAVTGRIGRVIQQLSWDAATLLEASLIAGDAPLILRGAASVRGISPRVVTAAHGDSAFASRLRAEMGVQPFTRETLAFALLGLGITEAITLVPPAPATQAAPLAEALADRIIAHWVTVAGQHDSSLPLYVLQDDLTEQVWDLALAFQTERWIALDDARMDTLLAFVAGHGTDSVISRRALDRFPKGMHRIHIHANLPFDAAGLHFSQVSLMAPPHPPDRPAPTQGSAVFGPGIAEGQVDLHLSLGEELVFTSEALAVVGDGANMRQVSGGVQPQDRALLVLGPEEFGIRTLTFTADPALIDQATVTVGLTYTQTTGSISQDHEVTAATPLSVIIPAFVADGASLTVTARSLEGEDQRMVNDLPLDDLHLSPYLFPGVGTRDVVVRMTPAPAGVAAIEVARPNDQSEVFSFTADAPERVLRHSSASLFETALRWRWIGTSEWQFHALDDGTLEIDPQTAP